VSKVIFKNVCFISAADGFLAVANILLKPASPAVTCLPAVASVNINVDVADVVDILCFKCPYLWVYVSAFAGILVLLATLFFSGSGTVYVFFHWS
jgi:hypothetical protein